MKPQVVYWNNIAPPYMVDRFTEVARREKFDFEVWLSSRTAPDRSWEVNESSWEFRYRYLPRRAIGKREVVIPTPLLRANAPDVLVSLHSKPEFVAGWVLARARGVRTAFYVEATHDSMVKRRAWKEQLKRVMFARADGILTPGLDGCEFAMRYGARWEQIFYLPYFVDFPRYADGEVSEGRTRVRMSLGLRGVTFVYVGRLWHGKGLDTLLTAFGDVQRRVDGPTSLLIVGDGPEERRLRSACRANGLQNVAFAGFQQRDVLPDFYHAGDIFVFPTLGDTYGLVVDEAMCCSLPVISTTAAGEIRDRVEEGITGFLVPPGDRAALCSRMELLVRDPALRKAMGEAAAQKLKGQTLGRWAEEFERAVEAILSVSGTRTLP
jgi:glycosyltransferase involved in cell wall biosynthesis